MSEIIRELPVGSVKAEISDLFTEGDMPRLKLGIKYFEQRLGAYLEWTTNESTIDHLLFIHIDAGKIWVVKNIKGND